MERPVHTYAMGAVPSAAATSLPLPLALLALEAGGEGRRSTAGVPMTWSTPHIPLVILLVP